MGKREQVDRRQREPLTMGKGPVASGSATDRRFVSLYRSRRDRLPSANIGGSPADATARRGRRDRPATSN